MLISYKYNLFGHFFPFQIVNPKQEESQSNLLYYISFVVDQRINKIGGVESSASYSSTLPGNDFNALSLSIFLFVSELIVGVLVYHFKSS